MILEKEKCTSHTITRLKVFICVFDHTCVENLQKVPDKLSSVIYLIIYISNREYFIQMKRFLQNEKKCCFSLFNTHCESFSYNFDKIVFLSNFLVAFLFQFETCVM